MKNQNALTSRNRNLHRSFHESEFPELSSILGRWAVEGRTQATYLWKGFGILKGFWWDLVERG